MNGINMKYVKSRKIIVTSLCALMLTSCFFDSGRQRITGRYYVLWIDLWANQTISKQYEKYASSYEQLVPEYVFSVGHNDEYIIAKQHPTNGFDGGYKVDTTVTNYFIIDMNKETSSEKNKVLGPFTIHQFDSLRQKLAIEDIQFDMNYPDIP